MLSAFHVRAIGDHPLHWRSTSTGLILLARFVYYFVSYSNLWLHAPSRGPSFNFLSVLYDSHSPAVPAYDLLGLLGLASWVC